MIVECPHCKEKVDVPEIAPEAKTVCPNCQGEINNSDIPVGASPKAKRMPRVLRVSPFILIAILAAIGIIKYFNDRTQTYDASAKSAGRNAKLAECICFNDVSSGCYLTFTDELSKLSSFNEYVTDDPEVTFIFGDCNSTGYTFTTQHVKSSKTFLFTD
jgi:hypothetical protein